MDEVETGWNLSNNAQSAGANIRGGKQSAHFARVLTDTSGHSGVTRFC
jgi:hypothetical protein